MLSRMLTREEADELTRRINFSGAALCDLLQEAKEREAWKALGYPSWREYATAELSISQSRAYQLLGQAKVRGAIRAVANSTDVEISEAAARDIRPVLDEVVDEVRERVEAGESAEDVVPEVVEKHRQKPEPEDEEPDDFAMVAELERCEKECERLREQVRVLSASDLGAEVVRLSDQIGRLTGLLEQRDTTTKAATDTLRSQNLLLDRIKKALKVATNGAILEAIADLKR